MTELTKMADDREPPPLEKGLFDDEEPEGKDVDNDDLFSSLPDVMYFNTHGVCN